MNVPARAWAALVLVWASVLASALASVWPLAVDKDFEIVSNQRQRLNKVLYGVVVGIVMLRMC
jgi:hypothetical protein